LANLDPLSGTVFACYFVERMSAKEIADALGMDPRAVYVRARTLRRRFDVALSRREERQQ
jgi:DNA-directed RNA polymerase specialized sigma24 family protein